MSSRLTAALLLIIFVIATVAMGLTFDATGLGGVGAGGFGGGGKSSTLNGKFPHLLVEAFSVPGGELTFTSSPGSNDSRREPMTNLLFTLTATEVALSRLGRPLTYYAFTNASGLGTIAVAAGNYSIEAATSQFNLTRPVSFRGNLTTELVLVVTPVLTDVVSLTVVNPDQAFALQPGGLVYAEVPGAFNYDRYSLYQIIGQSQWVLTQSGGTSGITVVSLQVIRINATVVGFYGSPGGTTVVLSPSGSFGAIPAGAVRMLQYVANSTVRFIGG